MIRDESAIKAMLEAAGLTYYPGIAPLPSRVTGKGVDAANSEHGDRACIVDFCDNAWLPARAFACPDANQLGARVVKEARAVGLDPVRVGVDAIGVGAGTVNEARRLGYTVQALYAGGAPMPMVERLPDGQVYEWSPDVNLFKNLRGQMYWQAREDLRKGLIDGPEDRELWQELTAPTFEDHNKVVELEAKDDIRVRLGRSPDCFVAGTMIRTPTGQRPIESLRLGDRVSTPLGTRRVTHVWETSATELTSVHFRNGRKLVGKGSHTVFTWDSGFVRLDALSFANMVELDSIWRRIRWACRNLWYTQDRRIGFKQRVDIISRVGMVMPSDCYIVGSGGMHMARSLRTTLSTIGTALGRITTWVISNASHPASTSLGTGRMTQAAKAESLGWLPDSQPPENWPRSGMAASLVASGIARTRNERGRPEFGTTANAQSVASSFSRPIRNKRDTVHGHVRNAPPGNGGWRRLLDGVFGAAKNFITTRINHSGIVRGSVAHYPAPNGSVPVFNLTLDRDNVYYANGVLVSNCADAFVMANWVRARAFVPVEPEEQQGVTLGYDYEARKPRDRETGEQWLQKVQSKARPVHVTANRFGVPQRRGPR